MTNKKRDEEIRMQRRSGKTLKQISVCCELSPERIRQICGEANSPSYRGRFVAEYEQSLAQ